MKPKLLLTLALLLSAVTGAWADGSWTSGGCDVTLVGGTLTVSKSSSGDGAMENYTSSNNQPWKNSRNNITSVVIGDGVTSIGNYAFRECSYLTSVTIGSNVGSIGTSAFDTCLRLASVSIPASVTSIGDYAFVSCGTSAAALVVTIADGSLLSSIGVQAFFNANLASFNIPASVTNIGSNAFYNCSNLSSVIIQAPSLTTYGEDAFGNYKSGRKIYVPTTSYNTYTTTSHWSDYTSDIIGFNGTCGATGHESDVVYALTGESPNRTLYISGTGAMKDNYKPWSDFTTVIIGDGVTHIGKQSFDYLNFTSLTIGNGVKSIGELAFHNCSGLTSIVIPNSVETIGEKAFEYITTLTSLTIGSGVTSMADYAFDYCENVTSLTISDGVTTIGKGAFEKYSSLTSVVIPSSVTSIGKNAFKDCPQLSSVVIQATSVPTCGGDAFAGNKSGRNIFVPATNLNAYKAGWTTYANDIIGYNGTCGATGNESNVVYALTGTSPNCTLYIIGTGAMMDCGDGSSAPWYSNRGDITSVVIGDGVTTIGAHAFGQNNNTLYTHLTSLTIGNDVTTIGDYAFYHCTGLTSVVIPNSVQTIKSYAFEGCSGVTSLTIGSGVTTLEDHAFYGLGITSLIIPANVTTFGNSVFNSCSNLKSVLIRRSSLTNYGYKVFNDNASGRKIFVPSGSENTYKNVWKDTEWGNYVDDIIGYNGTCGATGNESNLIWALDGESPNCTLYIGGTGAMKDYLYGQLSEREWHSSVGSFKSVVIGEGVTSIGTNSFRECTNLTSATIGNSVTSIGEDAFRESGELESVTIGNSVTSIGDYAFRQCTKLESVTIPNSVTSIGKYAFYQCSGLTSAIIGNNVESIGVSAFYGCTNLTSVTIPNSMTSISNWAFVDCKNLTSVAIPNSVTTIGEYAFNGCSGLTSVTIPASVTTIDQYAFSSSTHLRSVTFYGSPTCSLGVNAFNNCDGSLNIYVFSDLESSFESAEGWSSYATIINPISVAVNPGTADNEYWSTYYNPYANAKVTGAQVFKAALNGTSLTLTPISDGIINMGEAVILKSTSASSITLASAALPSATSYTDNDLKGTTEEMNGAAGNIYVLNKTNENGVGFYKLKSTGTIGANKAYLTYSGGGGAGAREFFLFDEATGIEMPTAESNDFDGTVYDLQGRRVLNPTKGLYIVNGKKVFINK